MKNDLRLCFIPWLMAPNSMKLWYLSCQPLIFFSLLSLQWDPRLLFFFFFCYLYELWVPNNNVMKIYGGFVVVVFVFEKRINISNYGNEYYLNIIFIKLSQKYKIHGNGTEWRLEEKNSHHQMLKHQKQSKLFTILCLWFMEFSKITLLLLLCVIFFKAVGSVVACLTLIHV